MRGELRIQIWKNEKKTDALELQDPAAVPLRAGDWVRIEASTNRPAFLYLVNLDSTGNVLPLYPWRDGDWRKRREERPQQTLCIPDSSTGSRAAPLGGSPDGTESLVLIVRDRPLNADENDRIATAFQQNQGPDKAPALEGPAMFHGDDASVEFVAAQDRVTRGVRGFVEPQAVAQIDDVVQRLRHVLAVEIKPLIDDSVAVCYPFRQK